MTKKHLKYIGAMSGFRCYINSEGFIEGYKSTGKPPLNNVGRALDKYKRIERVVSNCRDTLSFAEFVEGRKPKRLNEEKYTNQELPISF